MKYVLYLGNGGEQLWRHDGKGWQAWSGLPDGSVWVVADLAEESFTEIRTPRLLGRDRSAFITRQLATAYPDTPFRAYLTPPQEDRLFGSLMPTRQVLFGINAAERLNQALDDCPAPVAGVWPISMLLAGLCRRKDLSGGVVVVLPGPDSMRIVYLRDGIPILTRLTSTPGLVTAQVEEVVRTLNYLEKNQSLSQARAGHPVLFLAATEAAREALLVAGLRPVELAARPGVAQTPMQSLFDIVVKSPPGQLAPIERRTRHLALDLDRRSRNAALAVFLAGLVAVASTGYALLAEMKARRPQEATIARLSDEAAALDEQLARFHVAPEHLRQVIGLHEKEITSVPELADHLTLIAGVIGMDPNLRVNELQWRLLDSGATPCTMFAETNNPAAAEPAEPARKVEIGFDLAMPESYGARDRAAILGAVSARLAAIAGATVWKDAAKSYTGGSLSGGSLPGNAPAYGWCLTLPGEVAKPDQAEREGSAS